MNYIKIKNRIYDSSEKNYFSENEIIGSSSLRRKAQLLKLNPKLNRELVDAGLQRINISLEGLSSERYLKVAKAKINWDEFLTNIKDLYDYSRKNGDLVIYVKVVNNASELNGKTVFSLSEDEKKYFYKNNIK